MHAEERISKLEDKTTEIILSEEHKDERKNEKSLSNLWDTVNGENRLIIGVPEREECENGGKD